MSRSRWVTPGRSIRRPSRCSQASRKSKVGRSCSRARSTSQFSSLGQVAGRGLAEAEVTADLPEVLRPRLPPPAVPRQLARGDVELPRHEGDDRLGGGAQVVGAEAQEAERAELEGEPQAVGGRGRPGDLPAVRAGEGEVGLDVAGDDLGGEAVEPLAFRVAEEPDGHGGLLRGTAARGSRKRRFPRRPGDVGHGDAKSGHSASRKPFSESISRKCTGTMGFEKAEGEITCGSAMPGSPPTSSRSTSSSTP